MSHKLFSYKDVDVYPQHLWYFEPGQWLDDVCINFAFKIFEDEDSSSVLLLDPSVVSFIRLQLEEEDEFTELAEGQTFDKYTWIFLPISDSQSFSSSGTHWSLLIWHYQSGSFFHADSSNSYNSVSATALARKLLSFMKISFSASPVYELDSPQQQNGYDCGLYTILFSREIYRALLQLKGNADLDAAKDVMEASIRSIDDSSSTMHRSYMIEKIKEMSG